MFGFSIGEIIFISVLALVVVGPKQLPVVARNIARFLNDLKRASSGLTDEFKRQARIDLDQPKPRPPMPDPAQPPSEAVSTQPMVVDDPLEPEVTIDPHATPTPEKKNT